MTTDGRIRVLVVDDHKVVRKGLRTFMSVHNDLELVGEAGNGEEAIEQCAALRPDVILMDMKMPVMDGPTAIERIRDRFPEVQIVALTSFDDEGFAQRSLEAGAIGYLFKDVDEDDLMAAIRFANQGRGVVAPAAMQALVARSVNDAPEYAVSLTEREQATLELLAADSPTPRSRKS